MFIVYPRFYQVDDPSISVEILQSVLCLLCITGTCITYFKKDRFIYAVKYLIIIFSVMMIISNFHQYHSKNEADEHEIGFKNF